MEAVMAEPLLPEELWKEIKPLLPAERPKAGGGRPRVSDRDCLIGIIFVLRTGIPWRFLPAELGCGSPVTCWRRLKEWTQAGVWSKVHAKLVRVLGQRGRLDRSTGVIDSASVRALFGGRTPAPTRPIGRKKAANGILSRMVPACL
jgi:transposase